MDRIPPAPAAAILQSNLDALRAADPPLAERLTDLDLSPFDPTFTRTRDGKSSFRLTRPGGQTEWLGRSSIPGVRAAALLEQFDPGQGNVLLPAFGEGTEVAELLKKLEAHRVVFVWEADLVTLRLAMALHDYATALRTGRLIILQCPAPELTEALADWLVAHPDRQCPARILRWPWQSSAEVDQVRTAVETAWRESSRRLEPRSRREIASP